MIQSVMAKLHWRTQLLLDGRAFPLIQRLAYICRPGRKPPLETLLAARLRRSADGTEYFDMNGTRIYFRLNDRHPIHEPDVYRGTIQILREAFLDDPAFFCDEVRLAPGYTVLDLGGNLGTSAMLFARHVGPTGRVYSFEPIFHPLAARNMRENGVENVEVVPLAVGSRCGEAEFVVTDLGIDSRMCSDGPQVLRRSVPLTTVDAFCRDRRIDRVDFIKMDIEGAEEAALRGAEHVLRSMKPRLSIASYHTDDGFGGEPQHEKLVALLRGYGYTLREQGRSHIYAW